MRPLQTLVLVCSCVFTPQIVGAAPDHPDVSQELKLIESTEGALDPLGIDSEVGSGLDQAAARLKAPAPPPPPLRVGAALSAVEPVFERSHVLRLRWEAGLMHVEAELVLASKSGLPAAVAYRLPVPEGSVLTGVKACSGSCAPGGEQPAFQVVPIVDTRGSALSVSAEVVRAGSDLKLVVRYTAPAELHGGVVNFTIPARGEDPRLVPPQLTLSGPPQLVFDATPAALDDSVWPIGVRAELRAPYSARSEARCGRSACSRSVRALPYQAAAQRETWLWLDASPSMEGTPRNRADRVLAALLADLPESTPLHVSAFAAKMREIGRFRASDVPLRTLSDALSDDLGNTSRLRAALEARAGDIARTSPRIVIVSDGALDPSDGAFDALRTASARGAEVWLLNVGDARSDARLQEITLAKSERLRDDALADVVRRVSARQVAGIRTGEAVVDERGPKGSPPADAPWLWAWLAHDEAREMRDAGTLSVATRSALLPAPAYVGVPPPEPGVLTGMPKESVLSMLRTQLVPRARACLRSDRAGRADYAVQLSFEAEFAKREIYDTRIGGDVPRALKACLVALLPELRVPQFTGRVRVRYPIHTERELLPQAEELPSAVVESVNRALGTRIRGAR